MLGIYVIVLKRPQALGNLAYIKCTSIIITTLLRIAGIMGVIADISVRPATYTLDADIDKPALSHDIKKA